MLVFRFTAGPDKAQLERRDPGEHLVAALKSSSRLIAHGGLDVPRSSNNTPSLKKKKKKTAHNLMEDTHLHTQTHKQVHSLFFFFTSRVEILLTLL